MLVAFRNNTLAGSQKEKAPLQPKGTPQIFPRGSYPANAHAGKPLSTTGNAAECTFAQVNDAVAIVRPVVIDFDYHAATIRLICDPHATAKWQAAMRCCHGLRIEAFAAGSEIAVEAWPVEACSSARGTSLHCSRRKSTKSKGSRKKNSFEHLFGKIVRKGWESPASNVQLITISLAIASPCSVLCFPSKSVLEPRLCSRKGAREGGRC